MQGPHSESYEYFDVSKNRVLLYSLDGSWMPFAHGYYGEVLRCTIKRKDQPYKVAVKRLNPGVQLIKNGKPLSDDEADARAEERLRREVKIWLRLKHRHVAPLVGYMISSSTRCLITPLYENGAIAIYARNRTDETRVTLLSQAASGLAYLHKEKIVHHDIKSANIMVDHKGKAVLIDFGVSYDKGQGPKICTSSNLSQSWLWNAPEKIWPKDYGNNDRIPQYSDDIWAFGCLILEVFNNAQLPWIRYQDSMSVWSATKPERRELPGEPSEYPGVPACLWNLCTSCWNYDRSERPDISSVCDSLKKASTEISA
ncbi:hypothetical protein FRC02_011024 [Tulasnella sp. 418]|nr:hypothetical protein FRC02_011024 [Tulasnella sp. 418]